jgi:thiol-disulfide isomerase/thioredoxin
MRLSRILMPAVLTGVLLIPQTVRAADAANKAKPGQEVEIQPLLLKGKINIVDFFSKFCPPCMAISPKLEQLEQKSPDIHVIKLDINRPDIKGIDWTSPLAREFSLQSIPHFKIFDGEGKLMKEGDPAFAEVDARLKAKNL